MLSIEKCKEILNRKGKKYTNEEVIIIRESLYLMADIIHDLRRKPNE
jgi:hypothetical protein